MADIQILRGKVVTAGIAGQARVLPETENITPWQKRHGANIHKKLERVRFDCGMGSANEREQISLGSFAEALDGLVVRIGGYTDYFTRLIPEMQREVIQRMEFDNV